MNQDDLDTLTEVRQEIRRINQAAMRTIFNPAATEALEEWIENGTNQINFTDSKEKTWTYKINLYL